MTTATTHHEENWTAAGMTAMFDDVHRKRDRRRYRRWLLVWTLGVAVSLGVPLWVVSSQLQDARRQTLLEEYASQRAAAEPLAAGPPSVQTQLARVDALRDAARTKSVAEAIADLRQALGLLAETHALDAHLKQARKMLDPLGKSLLETPWHTTSTVIDGRQKALKRRHGEIGALLEQGKVTEADAALARLLAEVGELQQANVEAFKTDAVRQNWLRIKLQIPARLTDSRSIAPILRRGADGDSGWNTGDWNNSRHCYAGAAEDLQKLLEAELSDEERSRLSSSDAETIARLESEKADWQTQAKKSQGQLEELRQQLATTNGERQTALAEKQSLVAERDQLKAGLSTATTELQTLRPLPTQLDTATKALETTQQQLTDATTERDKLSAAFKATNDKAERLERLLAASPAAGTGDLAKKVEEEILRLEGLDTKDWNAANRALGDTLADYRKLVQERTAQLRDYQPTSPTIRALDAQLVQQASVVRKALEKLDQADRVIYEDLGRQIAAKQAEKKRLIEVEGRRPDSSLVRQIEAPTLALESLQKSQAAGYERAMGRGSPLKIDEIVGRIPRLDPMQGGHELTLTVKSVPVRFRWCPPGTYQMGSPESDPERYEDEKQVTVTLTRGFWIMETECWQRLWVVVMGEPRDWGKGRGDQYPAYDVSHDDASSFAAKLYAILRADGQLPESWRLVLPTEAQLEYAIRAGSTTRYCFGDDESQLGDYAWYDKNSGDTTHPVGTKKPNAWGLHDGHGSVFELTEDWYAEKLTGGTDPTGPKSGSDRVNRGGSWYNSARECWSARRNKWAPGSRYGNLGFRLALVESR